MNNSNGKSGMNSVDPSISGYRSPTGVIISNNEENSKNTGIGAFGQLSSSDATILSGDMNKNNVDDFIGLNYFNYPLDHCGSNIRAQKTVTYIQALADMLVCPNTNFPISIGLFSRIGAGIRTTHLEKLSDELISLTKINNQKTLQPSFLLFMFPVFIFIVIGIIAGIGTNWVVGVSMGASLSLSSFLVIEIIIFGSNHKRWGKALRAAQWLASFTQSLRLFLDILFRYPHENSSSNKPLSVIITHHNLSNYSSASHMTLSIVEKLWKAIEKKYSCLLTRLQISCKNAESPLKFKNICCIPIFVLVIIFFVAIIINATLFTIYNNRPMDIFVNKGLLPLFVIMTCIVFLCIFGTLPLLCRTTAFLIRSPSRQLKQMSDSESIDFQASDTLVKNEILKLCQIISIFESYLNSEKIRLFVFIDAADTESREKLANSIYLINGLIQMSSNAPIALILAADFQTLNSEWSSSSNNPLSCPGIKSNIFQEISDNFHLIHSTIHLPIYMEEGVDFHRNGSGKKKYASNGMFCIRGGNSFESLNMVTTGNKQNSVPVSVRKTSIYLSALNSINADSNNKGVSKSIHQLFLTKGDLTEINNKMIKQLTAAAAFIGRLLRINLIEFKLENLVSWLSISINWPYQTALMTLFLEEQCLNLTPKHTLLQIHEQVLSKVGFKDSNPSEIELLARDDRDFGKLDAFIRKDVGTTLTFSILKYFVSWSPFMNPYLRCILRDYLTNKNAAQNRGSRNQLTSPPLTSMGLSEPSDVPIDEDLPHPITSPAGVSGLANQITSWSKSSVGNLANKGDRPKTPMAIKRCMVKLKDGYPGKDLSQLDKYEIGILMSQIEGLSSMENIEKYKEKLIQLNVTGLVLSVCDMDQLQNEMEMNFGDWQLFKTLINHLRSVEAFKSDDLSLGGEPFMDPNSFWEEADIDGESDEDDDRISQTCWGGYGRSNKAMTKRMRNTMSKSRSQTNNLRLSSKRNDSLKNKIPQSNSMKGSSASNQRKSSLNYSKPGYIYSPLAADENVISNNHPIDPEKTNNSSIPNHRSHSNQISNKYPYSTENQDPIAFLKSTSKLKDGSNGSLCVHAPGHSDKISTDMLKKKSKHSYRSLSQSQERIHLVRARACSSNNMDRCATYIPVLLQTSLGGCVETGDQECTCDYWFRIEHQNGLCHKIATSEPASRVPSRPQTSPEGSDEEENPRSTAYWPESVANRPFNGSAV